MEIEGKMGLRGFTLEHGVWEVLQSSAGVNDIWQKEVWRAYINNHSL